MHILTDQAPQFCHWTGNTTFEIIFETGEVRSYRYHPLLKTIKESERIHREQSHPTVAAFHREGGTVVAFHQHIESVGLDGKRSLRHWQRAISALAFSPDGLYLALGDQNGTICLLRRDLSQIRAVYTQQHRERVVALAWLLAGKIVSADIGGTLQIWDALTGQILWREELHAEVVNVTGYLEDLVAVSLRTGEVRLYGGEDHAPLAGANTIQGPALIATANKIIAIGNGAGIVYFWRPDERLPILLRMAHARPNEQGEPLQSFPVSCLAFSPNGRRLLSCALRQGKGEASITLLTPLSNA